jgi:hypothetical protein
MVKPVSTRYPRATTAIALLCAGFVTIATSQDNWTGGSSTENIDFSGENQRLELDIAPVEDRLSPFDYDGSLHLEVLVYTIAQGAVDDMRWSLNLPVQDGESFVLNGAFVVDGEQVTEDDGVTYGDPVARIGRLCAAGESSISGCLPCGIDNACSLVIEIDRCHPRSDEDGKTSAEVRIVRADGSSFNNDCERDGDRAPCDSLDAWMSLESSALDVSLCQ